MTSAVDCPACGKRVPWVAESRWRPFCCERCKLVDLGDWAAERHIISGNQGETPDDDAHDADAGQPSGRGH